MKTGVLLTVAALCFTGAGQVRAQDSAAGEALYQDVCRNCHGPSGQGLASFPRLTGLGAEQIVSRLGQYRAGERVGPNSALMRPIAADLSDEDMANLAAYITTAFE